MTIMATVTFGGVAPIPAGTQVRVLVDNPDNPKVAISIEDLDHKILYSSEAPQRAAVAGRFRAAVANYVTATVSNAIVYVNANQTALNLSGVTPV
jgi:hypothetical protein